MSHTQLTYSAIQPFSVVEDEATTIGPQIPSVPSGDSQPAVAAPFWQPAEKCDGAVQSRPKRPPRELPMPAATVKKEHMISGSWIWQHCALDAECRMLPAYEAEYLRTREMFVEQHNARF